MVYYIFFVIFFFLNGSCFGERVQQIHLEKLEQLDITINNISNPSATAIQSQQSSAVSTSVSSAVTTVQNFISTTVKPLIEKGYSSFNLLGSLLQMHRLECMVVGGALSLLFFYGYLYRMNSFIDNSSYWHCWKPEFSVADLPMLDQGALQQSLLLAIARKYMNASEPTNFMLPIINFYTDTQYEQQRLSRYVFLANILVKTPLTRILPLKTELVTFAQEKIKRLSYMQQLVTDQIAFYNVQQIFSPMTNNP